MRTTPHLPRLSLMALAAGATLVSTATLAGPRVGEVVGTPNTTNLTVQARVVSSTPVVAQVAVPTQVCYDEQRVAPPRSSGAGAILGAIAGGAAGNAVGKGAGKAIATGVGIIGGAILGDHVENDGRPGNAYTARRCEPQTNYENRVVAYNVVYEFAGQRYSTQMGQEPGATIPLQVSLTPAVPGPASPVAYSSYGAAPIESSPYDDDRSDGRYDGPRRRRHWD
jgi:uncharacterized protein YcfJ